MRLTRYVLAALMLSTLGVASLGHAVKPDDTRSTHERGRRIYERACLHCHGSQGKGDGPAGWFAGRYSSPRPHDFTTSNYKLRSTASGDLPTDQDLFRTVTKGIPAYMPSFSSLSEEDRWAVITYIKSFHRDFEQARPDPVPIELPPPSVTDASLTHGRLLYNRFGCQGCHGSDGRGDGPSSLAGELRDAADLKTQATDLTRPTSFKNGASPRDVYRSLMTGMNGTPMPGYADQLTGQEQAAWDLVHYILSLSHEGSRGF